MDKMSLDTNFANKSLYSKELFFLHPIVSICILKKIALSPYRIKTYKKKNLYPNASPINQASQLNDPFSTSIQ
jgi:hypothetical protein